MDSAALEVDCCGLGDTVGSRHGLCRPGMLGAEGAVNEME